METMVLDRGRSSYLVNAAHLVRAEELLDRAQALPEQWQIEKSSPFVSWIAGDFVEADQPNSNKQFWTAGDLELAEYSIRHSPLNMVHKFRQPVGFYLSTRQVKLDRTEAAAEGKGSMKIQALAGLWSHIFPFEAAQAQAADEAGLLFFSMECRGTHLTCAGDQGCGQTFDYMKVDTHCDHLLERSSIRHIVNPTFRGGALIVPPMKPGWKDARASILTDAVMQEAASYAAQNEQQLKVLNEAGSDLTASAWEQLMNMVLASTRSN